MEQALHKNPSSPSDHGFSKNIDHIFGYSLATGGVNARRIAIHLREKGFHGLNHKRIRGSGSSVIEIDPVHSSEHIITEIAEYVCSNINGGTINEATGGLVTEALRYYYSPAVERERRRFIGL